MSKETQSISRAWINGHSPNNMTPFGMRVEAMLYPFLFDGKTKRTENASLQLGVWTDRDECNHGHSVLLLKNDVAKLIGVLADLLAKMEGDGKLA